MNTNRRLLAAVALTVVAVAGSTAQAQLGYKLLQGITYTLSPNIGSRPNGPQPDQNIFRQRLIRNYFGDGYGYEFTRTFGTDSYGDINQFNLGTLMNASFQGSVHNRIEINRRVMPEIKIQMDTSGAPLNYNINTNPGAQTWAFSGSITSNVTGTINALGFYNLQIAASNTGTSRIDGYVLTDQQSTDFDIGPINVTGNIYIDLAASIVQALQNLPLVSSVDAIPSAGAAKDKNPDGSDVAAGTPAVLTDQQRADMLGHALLQAFLKQALADFTSGQLIDLQAALGLTPEDAQAGLAAAGYDLTPEPTTIALLAVPAVALFLRRRK